MSKYIKLEDALLEARRGVSNYFICKAINELPTIEIPTELNGVVLKDCDKVIAPFLKEHECDELWETVRALRDFYDWVTEEERIDNE